MTKLSFACGLALSTVVAAWSSMLMADTPAASAGTAAAAAPAAATAAPKAAATPKLVCESVSEAGSHMKKRVCLTPEQMEQRHKDSQQAARDMQSRAQAVNAEGKPPI